MQWVARLELGSQIHAFGTDYRVVGIAGPRLILIEQRSGDAEDDETHGRPVTPETWLTCVIVQADDFRLLGTDYDAARAHELLGDLDDFPPEIAQEARTLEAHLNEARMGYKSGNPLTAQRGEPRSQYDPAKVGTLKARLRSKGEELGVGERQLLRYHVRLRDGGVRALVDPRLLPTHAKPDVDPRVLEAMEAVRAKIKKGETLSLKRIRSHVIAWLRTTYPDVPVWDGEVNGRLVQAGTAAAQTPPESEVA